MADQRSKVNEQDLVPGGHYIYHADRSGEEQFEYIPPPPPDDWRTIRVSPAAFDAVINVRNQAGRGENRRDRPHQDVVASIMLLRDMDDPGQVDSIVQLVIDKKPEYRMESLSTNDLLKALEQKLGGSGIDRDQLLQLLQNETGDKGDTAAQKSDDASRDPSTVTKGTDKNAKSAS